MWKLFGKNKPEPPKPPEHAVLVYFKLSNGDMGENEETEPYFDLEEEIRKLLQGGDVGELDGNEIGGGFYTIFTYGPNADRLAERMMPLLIKAQAAAGSYLVKRYGKPGAREEIVQLGVGQAN